MATRGAPGRPQVTSRAEIEAVAFDLFARTGFDATTVDDIAAAAGIGRRTFFRYFASKNDVVWGDWDTALRAMQEQLRAASPTTPLLEVLRDAVVAYNRFDLANERQHRRRMELILHVPALQAHSTLRYAQWRAVVAEFVAARKSLPVASLTPQLVGYVTLGAAVSAYEQWLANAQSDLPSLLHTALTQLGEWARD